MTADALPEETFGSRLPPVNDRMLTTLFLAALLHAIIILGLSFTAPPRSASKDAAPLLEVVLVSERTPPPKKNPRARYLAQRNQHGAGNIQGRQRARIPKSSLLALRQAGCCRRLGGKARAAALTAGEDQLIASRAQTVSVKYFAIPQPAQNKPEMPEMLEDKPDLGLAPNDEGSVLQLQGDVAQHALWVTADTQESPVAVYLDAWRRKVERIGTINFPTVARQVEQQATTPVIEVAIAADGKLVASAIRHSSGSAEIDQAALAILKLASPFDPFPRELSQAHDELRFAYEWEFLGGQTHRAPCNWEMRPMNESHYLTNQLLIAMPTLIDPNFAQTVALVCEHSARGALALVLNKPLPMRMAEIFEQLEIAVAPGPLSDRLVLRGGPMQTDRGFVVHPAGGQWDSTLQVSDGIHVTTSRDILSAIASGEGPGEAFVALGYAGWDSGQLESEIRANAWLNAPATKNIVFDVPFEARWQAAAGSLGIDVTKLSFISGNA